MPFGMDGHLQSVVVQGRVYVAGVDNSKFGRPVMEYNPSTAKWSELLPYRVYSFGMTALNNQLVLVGGNGGVGFGGVHYSKALGVWEADSREWTHPYPEMPTARSMCSAVGYKEWLIVAGGVSNFRKTVSCVEVMNTGTQQWHTGQPTPTPWDGMRTAIVGDMCYFMGGYTSASGYPEPDSVYCVSLPALVSQAQSWVSSHPAWNEICGLGITESVPFSISGSLVAVGGCDISSNSNTTAIHLYQPGEWVKVGDLPSPCSSCTCTMITDREILVLSGNGNGYSSTCTSYLAHIIPS